MTNTDAREHVPLAAIIDERIQSTALEILRGRGPSAVTIESVAAASGVAKTTIYRRFENREAMLRSVVSTATQMIDIPPHLTAHETLRWYLGEARHTIENMVGRGTVAAILVDEDHEFTKMLLGMVRVRSMPLRENLRRRVETGELKRDLDIELLVSMLLGTFVAESIRGKSTDDEWADHVIALLWPAISA